MYIYLITYEGQTENPYTWTADSYLIAKDLKQYLEVEFSNREWTIEEKDVG